MKVKWSVEVEKKREGMYRPLVVLRVWIEGDEWKQLNVDTRLTPPRFREEWASPPVGELEQSKWPTCPLRFYRTPDVHKDLPWAYEVDDKGRVFGMLDFGEVDASRWEVNGYMEWRPGSAPDYTDYLTWLAENICKPVVEEIASRIKTAKESMCVAKAILQGEINI